MEYNVVNLQKLLRKKGEQRTQELLSSFSCPLNPDIEDFLKRRAVNFARNGFSQTHLLMPSLAGKPEIAGYFCLTNKSALLDTSTLSATMRKRVEKFSIYDDRIKEHFLSAPLIAQLGKNYSHDLDCPISGDILLKYACDKVASILYDLGGRFIYLECADHPKLLRFYRANGFAAFDRRYLENDAEYLVRMFKYVH